MTDHSDHQTPLEQLFDLRHLLQADVEQTEQELRRRDRKIGLEAGVEVGPRRQLAHWLRCRNESTDASPGRHGVVALRLVTVVLSLIGVLLGWATAAAVFYYDGTRPVNVVRVLAVFVGLQLILMLLWLIVVLPAQVTRYVPGFVGLQEMLRLFSPGRLSSLAARYLPQAMRQGVQQVSGGGRSHQRIYASVQKWAAMLWSQGFAAAFHLGALGGALSMIVFADKWFGWSTTLQVSAAEMYRLTTVLSMPWSAVFADAVPSIEMIDATRYYQINPMPDTDPALLGAWWKFLIACMLVYGLLPRVLTVLWSRWRFAAAVHVAIMNTPGVMQLLDRMNRQLIETQADQPEVVGAVASGGAHAAAAISTANIGPVINWSSVDLDKLKAAVVSSKQTLHAGGAVEQDRQVLDELGRSGGDESVAIVVKGWEPPMEDFVDFVKELRQVLGDARPMMVIPLGLSGAPTPLDLSTWRDKLASIGDPWLVVQAPDMEAP
jgi:hypothetical protein